MRCPIAAAIKAWPSITSVSVAPSKASTVAVNSSTAADVMAA
jgi:hypothetical protein